MLGELTVFMGHKPNHDPLVCFNLIKLNDWKCNTGG